MLWVFTSSHLLKGNVLKCSPFTSSFCSYSFKSCIFRYLVVNLRRWTKGFGKTALPPLWLYGRLRPRRSWYPIIMHPSLLCEAKMPELEGHWYAWFILPGLFHSTAPSLQLTRILEDYLKLPFMLRPISKILWNGLQPIVINMNSRHFSFCWKIFIISIG